MAENETFKDVQEAVSTALINTTRVVGQISNEDLDFHKSIDPAVGTLLEDRSKQFLGLVQNLTKAATGGTDLPAPKVEDQESVDENWTAFVDIFDNLLEKTDACLDEYTGSIKRLGAGTSTDVHNVTASVGKQKPSRLERPHNLPKPQLLFERGPKNHEHKPFKPLLDLKPHALVSLDGSVRPIDENDLSSGYTHPYGAEIQQSQYPPAAFEQSEPIPYLSFENTNATFVDTREALHEMLAELKQAKEIAIDLEHHDEHSYIGIVSLMQISTRTKDWVIDTLQPWRHELSILNEVFADPKIIKVLHGSFMDMIWLQRDFGLYVVGLFDTFHAAELLRYPKRSLAYLLKRFVDFDAAKQYQMADWRIRPLPREMFNYARSDTHFLLYIFDNIRNELVDASDLSQPEGNLVMTVMNNSKQEALQRYERPIYDFERGSGSMGWYNLLCRTPALFNREQFSVFRAVHQWRDQVARQEDESTHQVMPRHVLYNIARETPIDMPALLGCSHPISKIFHSRKVELLGIVKRAKIKGATGPEMRDVMQSLESVAGASSGTTKHTFPSSSPLPRSMQQEPTHPKSTRSVLALRSLASSLWGAIVSYRPTEKKATAPQSIELSLPLPPLTAEVSQDPKDVSQSRLNQTQRDPGARAQHEYIKTRPSDAKNEEDKVFTLKQLSGSRSSKRRRSPTDEAGNHIALHDAVPGSSAAAANGSTNQDLLSDSEVNETGEGDNLRQDMDEEEITREAPSSTSKLSNRARKDEARRRRKAEHRASANGSSNPNPQDPTMPVEAFDYASAPSVFNANRTPDQRQGQGKGKGGGGASGGGGGMNPYTKALTAEGPRAPPPKKMRKEMAGRSGTFAK